MPVVVANYIKRHIRLLDDKFLVLAADDIRRVPGEKFQSELRGMYEEAKARLEGEMK